jgi:uncharacterized protein with PIN domain
MAVAYVDTSCLVAIAFGERGAASLTKRLEGDKLLGRIVAHYRTNKADSVGHTRNEGTRTQ